MKRWLEIFHRFTGKSAILWFFILCALPTGMLSAVLTPPLQVPDEEAHVARAAGLLHGAIMADRKQGIDWRTGKPELITGVKADWGIYLASWGQTTGIDGREVVTMPQFLYMQDEPPDHRLKFVDIPNTATYFPAAYIPAALGMAVGLAANAPPITCILLARMFMLAAFLAIGAAALWITAFGEALLLTVLLFPMTLFLAGSVNQDGMLVAMACFACAAMTRGSIGLRVAGLSVFALFLGAKPPYVPLLAAFTLPLAEPGFWWRARGVTLAFLPVFVWVVLIVAFVAVPFDEPPYHPGPLYTGDRSVLIDHANPLINFNILMAQPSRFITMPCHDIAFYGKGRLKEMIGVLGPLQISLPAFCYRAWAASLAVALLGLLFSRRPIAVPAGTKVANFLVISVLLVVTWWLIMITAYLDWTGIGMSEIVGMQGRYLLPLLPFLLFAMPNLRWRFNVAPLLPALLSIAMGGFDIGYIPMVLVRYYYLH